MWCITALAALVSSARGDKPPAEPLAIGEHSQLFLDDGLIDETHDVKRQMGVAVKHRNNPVLRREPQTRPWESKRNELYGSVFFDPQIKKFRAYYRTQDHTGGESEHLNYAESDDGVAWKKPNLGQLSFGKGYPETNILAPPGLNSAHGACVFRDEVEADAARRYKMFTFGHRMKGIGVFFSGDGVRWSEYDRNPVINLISDTTQSVVYDPPSKKYLAYVRMFSSLGRSVGLSESSDFQSWSAPRLVFQPSSEDGPQHRQFYSLCVSRYQGIYVGLVWIYLETPESRDHQVDTAVCWPELAVSRDGIQWKQVLWGEPLLPLGPPGAFDHRQIRTASNFFVHDGKIWIYYAGSPHPHVPDHEWDIGLATLRLDGFVSMDAGDVPGVILTKPFKTRGGKLTINAAVQEGGYVKAELLAADKTTMPGFELDRCQMFTGDETSAALTWNDARIPAADNLRIRFVLKNAKLYSFTVKQADKPAE